jgi:hypothetical protein
MFTPASTRTGALRVAWEAPREPVSDARLWLLLADPETLSPDALLPEHLLRDLIRLPVEAAAGACVVHAPVGRPLGLALVGRDQTDAPCTLPLARVSEVGLPPLHGAHVAPAAYVDVRDRGGSDGVSGHEAAAGRPRASQAGPREVAGPLVVASRGATSPIGSPPAVAELAARLLASAPRPPAPTMAGGFGLTQPWYLARLAFDAAPRTGLCLIRRSTFISGGDVQRWKEGPPEDAVPLPEGCDGVVDGLAEEGRTTFYVVLAAGPSAGPPWLPLPLSPVQPPFERCEAPLVLGAARARLEAALSHDAPRPLRELRDAALRGLP